MNSGRQKREIPGTTILDGNQARKWHALDKICFSFNTTANREELLHDEQAHCRKYGLNTKPQDAIRKFNVLQLIAARGNVYYLAKLGGVFGLDVQDIGAQQTGMATKDDRARPVTAGR